MADDKAPAKLQFHYIKAPDYREVSCHGALGGPTPQGKIWMALYSERLPIPQIVEYEVTPTAGGVIHFDESKSKPSRTESRQGVIRHVEVSTYLDVATAQRIHAWLGDHIKQMQAGEKK